jgi:hypothetical protein
LSFEEMADCLRENFDALRVLGFRKTELYRIVPAADIADVGSLSADEKRQGIRHPRRCWVPFRKGDPAGNRWLSHDPLFIFWSRDNVQWLLKNSGKRGKNMPVVRNPHLYFQEGLSWQRTGRDVRLKVRLIPECVFDSETPVLSPAGSAVSAFYPLSVLNSYLITHFIKKFLSNIKYELNALRMLPLVVPTRAQQRRLEQLARQAIDVQTHILRNGQAGRQQELDSIQTEVNAAVEELYGVSGLGPFDEF